MPKRSSLQSHLQGDYEIVAGDLHEEYVRIRYLSGAKAANRWYWAQTVLSIPSLLSYSRSNGSVYRKIGVALIALAVLFTMLVVITVIEAVFQPLFGFHHIPGYVWLASTTRTPWLSRDLHGSFGPTAYA